MTIATWSSSAKHADITLSNSDKTAANSVNSGSQRSLESTLSKSSGKYYFEFVVDTMSSQNGLEVGIGVPGGFSTSSALGASGNGWVYWAGGNKGHGNFYPGYGTGWSAGDIIGVALDLDNNAIWFSLNGTWQGSATQGEIEAGNTTHAAYTGLTGTYTAGATVGWTSTRQITARFDPADITGTVPAGFTAGFRDPPTTDHGDATAPMPLSAAATGKVSPTHGDAVARLALAPVATGKVSPIHGTATIAMPLSIAAHGNLPGKGQATVAMRLSASAVGTVARSADINADLGPAVDALILGTMHVGGTIAGALAGPESTIVGTLAIVGAFDAPMAGPGSALAGYATIIGVIDAALGSIGAEIAGYVPVTATIDTSLGVLSVRLLSIDPSSGTWTAVTMNILNGAVTEYAAYDFNSLIEWNGLYYGANDDGIYLLDGDTDDGADIDAFARGKRTDHKSELTKRVTDAYLLAKSDKRLVLRVIADEAGDVAYDYGVPTHLFSGLDSVKVDIGRGLRARQFQYEVQNVEGADFALDGGDFLVAPVDRRRKR